MQENFKSLPNIFITGGSCEPSKVLYSNRVSSHRAGYVRSHIRLRAQNTTHNEKVSKQWPTKGAQPWRDSPWNLNTLSFNVSVLPIALSWLICDGVVFSLKLLLTPNLLSRASWISLWLAKHESTTTPQSPGFLLFATLQIPYLGFCSCEELGETGIWQLTDPPILPLTHGPTGGFNWRETLLQE